MRICTEHARRGARWVLVDSGQRMPQISMAASGRWVIWGVLVGGSVVARVYRWRRQAFGHTRRCWIIEDLDGAVIATPRTVWDRNRALDQMVQYA